MVKTITTPSGNEIKLSNAAAFLIIYKNQFGREPLKDLLKIQKAFEKKPEEEEEKTTEKIEIMSLDESEIIEIEALDEAAKQEEERKKEEKRIIEAMSKMDLDLIYNFAWALAKLGDFTKVKDPLKFYIENDDFYPIDHIETIVDMAMGSMSIDFTVDAEENEKN